MGKKKRKVIVVAGLAAMLLLAGCGNNRVDIDRDHSDYYDNLINTIMPTDLGYMLEEIGWLENYRFDQFDIYEDDFKYIDTESLTKLKDMVDDMNNEMFYDITDIVKADKEELIRHIEQYGGSVDKDGKITIDKESLQQYFPDMSEEERLQTLTEEELALIEGGVYEETTEETESDYVPYDSFTGNEVAGYDEEGFPVDADGKIVILGNEGFDPRTQDAWNTSGEKVWIGVAEEDLDSLTDDDNREYLRAYESGKTHGYSQELLDQAKQVTENNIKTQAEAAKRAEYEAKYNLSVEEFTFVSKLLYTDSIDGFYTSNRVLKTDGKYYLSWRDIKLNAVKATGIFEFYSFDKAHQINISEMQIPLAVFDNDTDYRFELVDYRLLDDGTLKAFYESYDTQGNLLRIESVTGKIAGGKFVPDDVSGFTKIY